MKVELVNLDTDIEFTEYANFLRDGYFERGDTVYADKSQYERMKKLHEGSDSQQAAPQSRHQGDGQSARTGEGDGLV